MGNCTDSSDAANPNPNPNPNLNQNTSTPTQQPTQQQPQPPPSKPTTTTTNTTPAVNNTASTSKLNPKAELELAKHNEYRTKHHANPLVISDWLCKGAQAWADHLAKNNLFQHSQCDIDGKGVGQNIYWTSAQSKGGDASKAWYDQIKDYRYGSGEGTFSKTGHFSQLVWKESKEVGFGYAGGVVVANYYPAGNLMGSWEKNVQKP